VFDTMKRTLERNLVKSIAGRLITCPGCGSIMDCKTTVVVSTMKGNTVSKTMGVCAKCWMKRGWLACSVLEHPETKQWADVVDGRTLFPNRRSQARRAKCAGCKVLYARATMFRQRAVKGVWCEACYMGPIFDTIRRQG
jgi:hypothetical protein